tara:strand:- start:55 stop:483 length:429 start_codon:yes stop_codon:yes gene_type:complete
VTNEEFVDLLNRHPQPCNVTLGGELVSVDQEAGRAVATFVATPEFCHSKTIVQGGFLCGMVDTVMTQALFAQAGLNIVVPTLEMKVSFLAPGSPGVIRAEGEVVRCGKSTAFLEGSLYGEDGTMLVRASTTARIIPKSPRKK